LSWLRLDDGFDTHPKLIELSEVNRWRWTRVLLHCARHQTQGHVKLSVLRELGLGRATSQLVVLGLLEQNGETGYLVHDWATFNPKDPTKAERQARWRARQTVSPTTDVDADVDAPVDERVDADVDGQGVHSRVGARARPVPSRPKTPPSVLPPHSATSEDGRTDDETGDQDLPLVGVIQDMPE